MCNDKLSMHVKVLLSKSILLKKKTFSDAFRLPEDIST